MANDPPQRLERQSSSVIVEDSWLLSLRLPSHSTAPSTSRSSSFTYNSIACDMGEIAPFNVEQDAKVFANGSTTREGESSSDSEEEYDDVELPSFHHPHSSTGGGGGGEKLSTLGLAVMVFYSVSGGPFGVETSVRSAGNFFTLLGFTVFPFVWSVQEAMMTAELGSTFPEASGGVAWVEEAFGPAAAWMSGYLGWMAGATDNAIYPVLFLDYLLQVVKTDQEDLHPFLRFLALSGTAVLLAYINWLGLSVAANMSIVICAIAMSPFLILTLVGAFQVDPQRWLELPDHNTTAIQEIVDDDGTGILPSPVLFGIFLRPWLNSLFWNLNSFDAAASFAEDIDDPGRVLPKAMGLALLMVVFGYLGPLLIALGASTAPQEAWVDGYLAKAASEIVGPWLGAWTVLAAGISNIALFQAELSADAFQLMGMADRGHVPKIFGRRSRHGTPTYGILLGTVIIVALTVTSFDQLIEMLNFNYSISLLMEYFAFIKLRISKPDLHRPFRVPLSTFGCIAAVTPTIFFTCLILVLADLKTYLFSIGVNSFGILIFVCMRRNTISTPLACKNLCYRKTYDPVESAVPATAEVSEQQLAQMTYA